MAQGVGVGRKREGRPEEHRVGGKVAHREHHGHTHRSLPWSHSQMDTTQNLAHQR